MRCTVNSLTPMTYVLASHCLDGIVLIADRKITVEGGMGVEYDDKIFSTFPNFLLAFAGSRASFETFKMKLEKSINDYKEKKPLISLNETYVILSDTILKLTKEYYRGHESFEVLVASDKGYSEPASIRHFLPDGRVEIVTNFRAIGTGTPYGSILLNKCLKPDMTMKEVAELGSFIIKYIEDNKLDLTVGVGDLRPQIWYMSQDGSRRQLEDKEVDMIQKNNDKKLNELMSSITNFWNQ